MVGTIFSAYISISTFKGVSMFEVSSVDGKTGLLRCSPKIKGYQKGNKGAYIPQTVWFTDSEIKSK